VSHDLDRHVDYLRAALQQDRRPLGLFFGAGTPMAVRVGVDPLIPDIAGLTTAVRGGLTGSAATLVETAFGQLPSKPTATLEDLLNYLRRLAVIPGTEPVRGFSQTDIEEADAAVCALVRSRLDVTLPATGTPYDALALWAGAALRHAPLEVFTTNYDLLTEQALEGAQVPYFDGFVGSHRPTFDLQAVEEDQLPDRWVRLWKLHGSINWSMSSSGSVVRCPSTDPSERTLIYPSHLKYEQSRRLPYLALLDRLRGFLRQPSAVLVSCGFSFRDEHVNDVVGQALLANPTASVQALLHDSLTAYGEAITLASRTPNLSLLAKDAAVVGAQQAPWTSPGTDAAFYLGDFNALGQLLRELVGARAIPPPLPATPPATEPSP
jgi:hypothetical protein